MIDRCQSAHPIAWTCGSAFLIEGEPVDSCIQRADQLLYKTKLAGYSSSAADPRRRRGQRCPSGASLRMPCRPGVPSPDPGARR